MTKNETRLWTVYVLFLLFIIFVINYLTGCDSGWTIAGWEVK